MHVLTYIHRNGVLNRAKSEAKAIQKLIRIRPSPTLHVSPIPRLHTHTPRQSSSSSSIALSAIIALALPILNRRPLLHVHHKLLSQDAVRVVLVAIVQLGRQRIQRVLDQLLHLPLQLLLRQSHVEAVPQIPHRG